MDPDDLIATLGLQPHPEGGHYAETWRHDPADHSRPAGTCIYFLLRAGERSRWHRVDATEIWHHYAGAALELRIKPPDAQDVETAVLGDDLGAGERPQVVVPAHAWQEARSLGDFTLVGCTVSPGFEFAGFELAEEGFRP